MTFVIVGRIWAATRTIQNSLDLEYKSPMYVGKLGIENRGLRRERMEVFWKTCWRSRREGG